MVQYYGKFIRNLSMLAAPLNALRKKGVEWRWNEELQKAFEKIKKRLTEIDVLAHYNPDVPVVLATDASDYGLGAVIYHKYKDGNEKLEKKDYAHIEKEALP
ncbi:hypothetical protein COOONC_11978 [Cooperia oncophora]